MYCSNCGNQIEDGARFCPYCGAQNAPSGAARLFPEEGADNGPAAAPGYQHGGQQRPARPNHPVRPAQAGADPFTSIINGSRMMAPMPKVSLIMFMIYGAFLFTNTFAVSGMYLLFFGFVRWFTLFVGLGAAAMFVVSYFNKSRRRLFFLIGCAALALLYTVSIFRGFWAFIVFGILQLGCVGAVIVYYLFEGRIINHKIKMLGCIGIMLFHFLILVWTTNFGLTMLHMIPYVALALGFLFYSPYVNRQ